MLCEGFGRSDTVLSVIIKVFIYYYYLALAMRTGRRTKNIELMGRTDIGEFWCQVVPIVYYL